MNEISQYQIEKAICDHLNKHEYHTIYVDHRPDYRKTINLDITNNAIIVAINGCELLITLHLHTGLKFSTTLDLNDPTAFSKMDKFITEHQ